jgi:O-antigen ligase
MITVVAPHGLVDGIYFIGIRTRTTEVVFVQMALTLVLDYMRGVKLSFRSIISISAGIINLLISWVATAFAGLLVAILIFWIMKHSKKISKTLTVLFWTGISLLATLLVVVLRLQNLFAWFIEGVLNKNLTLTERTVIWDGALELIKEKPFFGYGMQPGGNIVPFAGSLWQTHNQWLQLLVDGGAITLISFVVVLLIVSISSNKYATSKSYLITISVFAAFTIMSTAEIYSYMPYFFILIFTIRHLSDIDNISPSENAPVQLQIGRQ